MKDIDFDELDKAVNSLMGGVKSKPDGSESKTLTIAPTLKEGEQPAYDKIQHAAEKIGSETLLSPTEKTAILSGTADENVNILSLSDAPLEPLVIEETGVPLPIANPVAPTPVVTPMPAPKPASTKAPSGRFMDVMHPSSDMKTTATTTPQSPTLTVALPAPTAPLVSTATVEAPKASSLVVPAREPRAVLPQEVKPSTDVPEIAVPEATVITPVVSDSNEPAVTLSPVEAMVDQPAPLLTPASVDNTPQPTTATAPEPAHISPVVIPTEPIEPLISPFLPDAKVEKRPLGGAVDSSLDEDDISGFDTRYVTDNSADTQLSPVQTGQPTIPDELHSDLLSIETSLAEVAAEQQPASATVSTPEVPAPQTSATQPDTPVDGAIFDTSAYNKTVAHPKKHTPEWVWIAAIIGIIVICAAAAAAFYLLGSQ